MTAIVIFELGSFFCPVAPFVNVLVFGRVFAGIGAGGISMSVLTIMTEVRPLTYTLTTHYSRP